MGLDVRSVVIAVMSVVSRQSRRGEPGQKRAEPANIGALIAEEGVVMSAANHQQGPGFMRRCKNCLAVVKRDDVVVATVNDQYGAANVLNVITCRVPETA